MAIRAFAKVEFCIVTGFVAMMTCLLACESGKNDSSSVRGDEQASEPVDDEGEPSDQPASVSGSFLTIRCSDFERNVRLPDPATPHRVGCVIFDRDGKPARELATGEGNELNIVAKSGSARKIDYIVAQGDSPWSIFFDAPQTDLDDLDTIDLAIKEEHLKTNSVDWNYWANELFAEIVAITQEVRLIEATKNKDIEVEKLHLPNMPNAAVATRVPGAAGNHARIPADMKHVLFASDFLVFGGIGLDNADLVCNMSGKHWDAGRKYKAVLGSSAGGAKSRVKITGPVYLLAGMLVAASEADFWSDKAYPQSITLLTESNADPFNVVTGTTRGPVASFNLIVSKAWSGSSYTGTAAGDHCKDWTTSAASGATGSLMSLGGSSPVHVFAPDGDGISGAITCNRRSRLLCISQ